MEFEIVDIDLGAKGNVVQARDDIALIDADTIVFASCLHCENKVDLLSEEFYTPEEWEDLLNDDSYNAKEHCIYTIDLDEAFNYSKDKINTILDNTGCKDYELHFTSGRKSFRYTDVYKDYKANRLIDNEGKRAPVGLRELKNMFCDKEPEKAFNWTEWEADDIVVAKKNQWPDKYLLVALDKDVLYSLEGTHFNYYSRSESMNRWGKLQKAIDMKFFEVTAEDAMKHHYKQTLTGDATDGVPGLHRIGAKTAEKILKDCKTSEECWDTVVSTYEQKGKDIVDAITVMRLVSMNQLVWKEDKNKFEVELWRP